MKNKTVVTDNAMTGAVLGLLIGGIFTWSFTHKGRLSLAVAVAGSIAGYYLGKKVKSKFVDK